MFSRYLVFTHFHIQLLFFITKPNWQERIPITPNSLIVLFRVEQLTIDPSTQPLTVNFTFRKSSTD